MTWVQPTIETLLDKTADIVESQLPGSNAHIKSTENVIAKVVAGAQFELYGALHNIFKDLIPSTEMSLEAALKWREKEGIPLKPGGFAKGTVLFTGVNGTVIPQGTIVDLPNGKEFTTDAGAVIASGQALVDITASEVGIESNAPAGGTVSLTLPIVGIDSDATIQAGGLQGGEDPEDEDTIIRRLLERGGANFLYGKDGDYAEWAKEIPGVTRAWEIKGYSGPLTMGIVFVMDNQNPIVPNGAKLTEVQEYVQKKASYVTVETIAPTLVPIDITLHVYPDTAQVREQVSAALSTFFATSSLFAPNKTLYISNISESISNADGEDSHDLIIPAANVSIGAEEVPVLGLVTFV